MRGDENGRREREKRRREVKGEEGEKRRRGREKRGEREGETVRGGWGGGIYREIPTELPTALNCCRCN